METLTSPVGLIVILAIVLFVTISSLVARYKRCPSDKILVIYGKTGGTSAKCIHGGGAFVWPVIQDFAYLDLRPLSIEANLTNALSRQNIRVDVPLPLYHSYFYRSREYECSCRAPFGYLTRANTRAG